MAGSPQPHTLRNRLTWLTVFRTVAVSLSLVAFAARVFLQPVQEPSHGDMLSFAVIGLVYLFTLVYGLMLRGGWADRLAAVVQVVGDLLIASVLVFLTGVGDSPFTFLYLLAVIGASILLDGRGALLAALASALTYSLLLVAVRSRWLVSPTGGGDLSLQRVAFLIGSNLLALVLIAVLAGYLSRQLSATGGRLSAREADLKKLGTLQQQILTCMPSGLITCDAEGRVTFVNRAASAILGLDAAAVVAGLPVESLLPGALGMEAHVRRRELSVQTREGARTLGLTVTGLGDTGSEGMLIVFQDLTELRRTEEDLRRADRLAALGTLAAQLAHEIRNPLAAMRGSAQLLVQESSGDPLSARLVDVLLRESDRLSHLVEDFLRFARPPPPLKQEVDLGALVAETVDMLRADPLARQVRVETALLPLRILVDADQLRQVLINLLRNAFQAAEEGGVVRVTLRPEDSWAELLIWDSGGRIPPAHLSRIFEPFFSTRQGGTGLGLSTAHSIVRSHGGNIRVSSSPQEGTGFLIQLPMRD
ncbi:PAS domain-containing sensor histidine kinase [Cystobacter fuscus]|uniref:histidine kinase n=1 Tax=Cystobacter fuscus TaxID=43 RepID=A0A250JG30_9BACT|nr:ATP-binding protein [Cystobacter fuscus]ATB42563.1 PAS domain-containing sensor histidine kinase [Cystobacter fuscus]